MSRSPWLELGFGLVFTLAALILFGDLWPCMDAAAWASWVQAIGSILALLLTAGVVWYQGKQNERTALAAMAAFRAQLRIWLEKQIFLCRSAQSYRLPTHHRALKELIASTGSFRMDSLPSAQLSTWMRTRHLAGECEEQARFSAQGGDQQWDAIRGIFERFIERLDQDADERW